MKKNTIMVGTLTLISLILGFGRESYIAYLFGSTQFTDAFYVSMIIPDIVAGWIGYTLINALIPVLKQETETSKLSSEKLISTAFNYVLLISALLAVAVFMFSEQIVGSIAPNFNDIQMSTGTEMLKIMSVAIIFSALSGLLSGINNTFEQYFFSSLVGIFYNGFFFVSLLMLNNWLGIDSLAYGLLVGVLSRCIIQIIPLLRTRILKFKLQLWHPSLPTVGKAMMPIFLSQAFSQINQIVDRILASGLSSGQITNLNYASKLGQLPTGLIGGTIATTMYIQFVKSANNNNLNEMNRLYSKGLMWIIFLGVLVSTGLILYGDSLVSIFYYHGKFTLNDAIQTTGLLQLYGIFSFFYMMLPISLQFFFSFHGGKRVMISSITGVIVNVTLGFILVHHYGVVGLVIANGTAVASNFSVLFIMAMRKVRINPIKNIYAVIMRILPGGIVIVIMLSTWKFAFPIDFSTNNLVLLVRGGMALFIVGLALILLSKYWKSENEILRTIANMMNNKKIITLTKKNKKKVEI
ncbi:putative lipid II flippase MurJ [Paenibacillus glycanilyticus]|uniref:Lipid II flippase MurJ n=1 Tax=Paenibacillus glycanilyticus TaxID=126569 RepID=A0ABQ6NTC1_9BACL|nr:murein biosynthesis integral membrane protein MurJ [Paenibacillus glycanilyticus]GMK48351.1 putative lipid II flippase MurJ [Paenibacillus glycanilyticus]